MMNDGALLMRMFVPGIPQTAGSKRGFAIGKRVIITDANKKSRPWKAAVADMARQAMPTAPTMNPVRMEIIFRLPRPKSHHRTGKYAHLLKPQAPWRHSQKPDLTKLLRGAEDGLKGIVWKDDCQVCDTWARKRWTDRVPGVLILIYELEMTR